MRSASTIAGLASLFIGSAIAQNVTQADAQTALKTIVNDVLSIYNNGSSPAIPGLFPEEYYWWESGLAWDSLIKYWAYFGDDTLASTIRQGILFQTGPDNDFMPPNQTKSLGNDDQSYWALAAMTAAEYGLPADNGVGWYELAQNVFDTQVLRWDEGTCAGGLRWQIFSFNAGYSYKSATTQANFALLGARLWRFTGNATYLEWAERAVEWSVNAGLVTSGREETPAIYDGTDVTTNCSTVNRIQWTINAGQFLSAFVYACNETCSDTWRELGRVAYTGAVNTFVAPNSEVLTEVACAGTGECNLDQLAFRAPLARALGSARDMPGSVSDYSMEDTASVTTASAKGAIDQCATANGCGSDWTTAEWDGTKGLGQDLAAMEAIMATLPEKGLLRLDSAPAVGNGSSGGNNSARVGSGSTNGTQTPGQPSTAAGKVNASSMAIVLIVVLSGLAMLS